jgi:glutamate dehydrogenase/leucine dehydrogenase
MGSSTNTKSSARAIPEKINIDGKNVEQLYDHLRSHSDLSAEAIRHEIDTILSDINFGESLFHVLGLEEISFLIENNRYQEKAHGKNDGTYIDIDVEGRVGDKNLFLVSETGPLMKKVARTIQEIMKKSPGRGFRLFSCSITSRRQARDRRRLLVLEETGTPDHTGSLPGTTLQYSGSPYAASIETLRGLLKKGEDILIVREDIPGMDDEPSLKQFLLWLPREKFQENFETINMIFQRKGISSVRQHFNTIVIDGQMFIALSTLVESARLTPEMETYLSDELYSRSMLLKSSPVSVGEIRDILDRIASARDHEKIDLITHMQRNKQKEFLIPLMVMLNDHNLEIRRKAFGIIRHYVLNPDAAMKNDYYWSTLKNIFSAATVPIRREKDRLDRSLFDEEIMNLIRFRGLHYETMTEKESGREFLFIRINGTGIGKGGIRAHRSHVSFSGEGALSTNMLFKCIGLGVPWYTIGKGGILGDLAIKELDVAARDRVRKAVLEAYADFLYYRSDVGPLSDVPAGDVGIGGSEISVIYERITDNAMKGIQAVLSREPGYDQEMRILKENFGLNCANGALLESLAKNRDLVKKLTSPAITGKPGPEGLKLRTGATARGLMEILSAQQNYRDFNDPSLWSDRARIGEALSLENNFKEHAVKRIAMLTFAIQGFGKVGAHFARMAAETGASIKMISDASGTLVDPGGLSEIAVLSEASLERGSSLEEIIKSNTFKGEFIAANSTLPLSAIVDVVVPAALEEVITTGETGNPQAIHEEAFEGNYLLQGANGPATVEAEEALENRGVIVFPDILANAGGVLASYMEWLKGLMSSFGYRTIFEWGFVHRITHNLVIHFHPDALEKNIREISDEVYEHSFAFIMRWSTLETINLSRRYKVSMRRAFIAIGIQHAADEGRLSEQFSITMDRLRGTFAERT